MAGQKVIDRVIGNGQDGLAGWDIFFQKIRCFSDGGDPVGLQGVIQGGRELRLSAQEIGDIDLVLSIFE